MIEKHSMHEYELINSRSSRVPPEWVYIIFEPGKPHLFENVLLESSECFDTEQEARTAVISHIRLLEKENKNGHA